MDNGRTGIVVLYIFYIFCFQRSVPPVKLLMLDGPSFLRGRGGCEREAGRGSVPQAITSSSVATSSDFILLLLSTWPFNRSLEFRWAFRSDCFGFELCNQHVKSRSLRIVISFRISLCFSTSFPLQSPQSTTLCSVYYSTTDDYWWE